MEFGEEIEWFESPLIGDNYEKSIKEGSRFMPADAFMPENGFVMTRKNNTTLKDLAYSSKLLKAGPRKEIYFNPPEVEALIVTCGGLCPGLNVVIREITMSLWFNYEVKHIYGIKWGYKGFYTDVEKNWKELNPTVVSEIHKKGGTILGSSRGGFDADKILEAIENKN